MIRSLARRETIGMVRIKNKVMSAILECEAPAFRDDTCAEPHVIAVDKRTGIAEFIHDAELYCIR